VVLLAIWGASAIYGSPLNWKLTTTKSQVIAGLSSAADVLKADLEAVTGQSAREQERSALRDLRATTVRLDQIEHEYGARLDKLERVDQDSPRFADSAARLDKLEKKAALPATPASESADVVARLDKLEKKVAVAATPASEIAGLTTRLNKLEKKAAVVGASSANPLPPAASKQSSLVARADPSAPNETAGSDYPAGLFERSPLNDTPAAASRRGDNSPGQAKNPPRERASGGCHHYREWRYPWPQQC
jgi:tetrahydromethanopterin S-methyltransferase subunit G